MLPVSALSTLMFNTNSGSQLIAQLNSQLKSLIKNDNSLISESVIAPGIWECKWLNNPNIQGYNKGQAIWMNAHSPQSILNSQYVTVKQYVDGNAVLAAMYKRAQQQGDQAANDFMLKAIIGKASSQVSALYCLGDISKDIQIRVSDINNNKTLPTDNRTWHDFYKKSDLSTNAISMMNCLSGLLSDMLSTHIDDYHISSLNEQELNNNGYFKRDPFDTSSIICQKFYDHNYCDSMSGFDYSTNMRSIKNDGNTQWCRIWKSGYVEQGGIIPNDGSQLISINFMKSYNYPIRNTFYQDEYNTLPDGITHIVGSIPGSNRYVYTVTPIIKNDAEAPYMLQPNEINGLSIYAYADATNFTNNGMSIVNCDTSKSTYEAYSWHVAGYVVQH